MKILRILPDLSLVLVALLALWLQLSLVNAQAVYQVDTLTTNQVFVGQTLAVLAPDPAGWQLDRRNFAGARARMQIVGVGHDTLVLQTTVNHHFRIQDAKGVALRGFYVAAAYRYVPLDSGLIEIPRWQWRRVLERLNRLDGGGKQKTR